MTFWQLFLIPTIFLPLPTVNAGELGDQLERLADVHDRGIRSGEEAQREKGELPDVQQA
ncbi:MAG: hypothetical protein WBO84_00385 [Acidimicrobiia bacterium]